MQVRLLLVGIVFGKTFSYVSPHFWLVEINFSFFVSTLVLFVLKYLQCLAFGPVYLCCFYRLSGARFYSPSLKILVTSCD